jgi:hypothetical protein
MALKLQVGATVTFTPSVGVASDYEYYLNSTHYASIDSATGILTALTPGQIGVKITRIADRSVIGTYVYEIHTATELAGITLPNVNVVVTVPVANTNLIPAMTSNTAPSGTVTASAEFSYSVAGTPYTYSAWHAFDHVDQSPFGLNDDDTAISWVTGTVAFPQWVQYQFPTTKIGTGYAIIRRSSSYGLDQAPKDFQLLGSNNGTTWTTLDSQTNQINWASNERRVFSFTNTTAYAYYRLNITNNNGSTHSVSLGELQILG